MGKPLLGISGYGQAKSKRKTSGTIISYESFNSMARLAYETVNPWEDSFIRQSFHGMICLSDSQFHGKTRLSDSQFHGKTCLSDSQFHRKTRLSDSQFHGHGVSGQPSTEYEQILINRIY